MCRRFETMCARTESAITNKKSAAGCARDVIGSVLMGERVCVCDGSSAAEQSAYNEAPPRFAITTIIK
jgi:microcompartment protein CcmK/EutM